MTRLHEIEERLSAIKTEMETDGVDLNTLNEETDKLLEERKALMDAAETRQAMLDKIAQMPEGEKIQEDIIMEERKYTVDSAEYRSAFLKNLMGVELNEEERTAFVHTTGTTSGQSAGNAVPSTMLNKIWDLVEEDHAILADITIYRTGTILEIAKRTAIAAGDAATATEGSAPSNDENNTFAKVTLSGKDFAKCVEISYALDKMSIDGFEDFLVNEIADRMGAALASDVITQIGTDYDSSNNDLDVASSGKIAWTDVSGAFSVLKNAKAVGVYASRATIYKYIVGMADTTGRPIFQPSANAGVEGYLLGAPVKAEDAITDDLVWFGDPKQVVGNFVQDIMVESDRDIKNHKKIYSGYARFQCALLAPKAFAKLDVTP